MLARNANNRTHNMRLLLLLGCCRRRCRKRVSIAALYRRRRREIRYLADGLRDQIARLTV